jgi:formamidopyrimidine-DNA glycosylase
MPELPEVQTTVNGINETLRGAVITDVCHNWERMFRNNSYKEVRKIVRGATIKNASRRGKHILIHLSNKHTIIVHMKMTGHLMVGKYRKTKLGFVPEEKGALADPFNRFIHVVFTLKDGRSLVFCDARKFGKISIEVTEHLPHSPLLAHLGPEPLDADTTAMLFARQVQSKPRGKIKQVLLDQSVIAGIGNIYSDELLWLSKVHPESRVQNIPQKLFPVLFKNTQKVLRDGLAFGGDSTSDYRNIHGEAGVSHKHHQAYQRKGKACLRRGCKGVIERIIVGARSAHFCPVCQVQY